MMTETYHNLYELKTHAFNDKEVKALILHLILGWEVGTTSEDEWVILEVALDDDLFIDGKEASLQEEQDFCAFFKKQGKDLFYDIIEEKASQDFETMAEYLAEAMMDR